MSCNKHRIFDAVLWSQKFTTFGIRSVSNVQNMADTKVAVSS